MRSSTQAPPRAARPSALPPAPLAAPAPAPAPATPRASAESRSLLRPLGIVGYDALEPALLAALATAVPLLLISDHGAAKTLLMLRLASAMQLDFRHYNASLLQFDDLAGFPIPDERNGTIRYVGPPGAIWGAEGVFFDEIGRCRPETANKLFPIVHERRIQGIALPSLRYRWAATNPPLEALDEQQAEIDRYEGVEQLDPALADRFAFVVPLPRFHELSDADRLAIIRGAGEQPTATAGATVRELVEATTDLIAAAPESLHESAAQYLLALIPRLTSAKVTIGGRRAATLKRNIIAVWAASTALGRRTDESAFAAAVLASIPDVARRQVSRTHLLVAHKAAWEQIVLPESDPVRLLLAVQDPVRRATLALTLPGVKPAVRGEALCGALAQLSRVDAAIVARLVMPRLAACAGRVPATAVETTAEIMNGIAIGGHSVRGYASTATWVAHVRALVAETTLDTEAAEYLCNTICALAPLPPQLASGMARQSVNETIVKPAIDTWTRCAAALGGERPVPVTGA